MALINRQFQGFRPENFKNTSKRRFPFSLERWKQRRTRNVSKNSVLKPATIEKNDAYRAPTVLKEANSMSNLGVEKFVQLQKYKDVDQSQKLLDTLTIIAT